MTATTPAPAKAPRDSRANTVPTLLAVKRDPGYWLAGPGRDRARQMQCDHGYNLTDSCPNCD